MGCYWQANAEEREEKPIKQQIYPHHISYGLARDGTRASGMSWSSYTFKNLAPTRQKTAASSLALQRRWGIN